MSIRHHDLLLYAGGECLQKFGVPVWSLSSRQRVAPQFSRTGAGPFVGRSGATRQASVNRPRIEWLDLDGDGVLDTPALLLEAAHTNVVSSDNFDAGWTSSGTPDVTSGISDPAGGTAAYRIADDDGAATEAKHLDVTFTGNGVKVAGFVVRQATMPSAGHQTLYIYDATALTSRLALSITGWASGVPSVTGTVGTYLGKRYAGNGYWVLWGRTTSVTAANTNRAIIEPATTAGQMGAIDISRVNAYDKDTPPWSIENANGVLGAETFAVPCNRKPGALSMYVKFIESGSVFGSTGAFVMRLGGAGAQPRAAIVANGSGSYVGQHSVSTGAVSTMAAAPAIGDIVELLLTIDEAGTPTLHQSVNRGAITTGIGGTAETFGTAWSERTTYLGPVAGNAGSYPIIAALLADRVQSFDDMRAVFPWRSAA